MSKEKTNSKAAENEKQENAKPDKEKLLACIKALEELGKKKDYMLTTQEVKDYCNELKLTPEQMDKVRVYLESHKIDVVEFSDIDADADLDNILLLKVIFFERKTIARQKSTAVALNIISLTYLSSKKYK